VELTGERAVAAVRRHLEASPKVRNPETAQQLLDEDALLARSISIRWFGTFEGREPAAICAAYSDGRTAQLAELSTLDRFRKRGHGYAVLAAALHAAAAQNDLVIGVADADGWQQAWYERLGFEPVARRAEVLRIVGATRA
jgi:ribosomal protein S18 acetylase RimI-like enzyme